MTARILQTPIQTIGFSKLNKLVFVGVRLKNAVIASQCAHWRGNPPVRGEMYRKVPGRTGVSAIFGGNRQLVPFNRGIATTSLRTGLAMTALFRQTPIYSSEMACVPEWRKAPPPRIRGGGFGVV